VLDRRAVVIEKGGPYKERFLRTLARRIQRSKLPNVTAEVRPLRFSGGWWAFHRALVVRHGRYSDIRVYVSVRRLGRNLEVLRLAALEPGWVKRGLASLLHSGAWWMWSTPRGIHAEEDVRSFLTVIDGNVRDAIRALAARLGARRRLLSGSRGDILDQWE
jgi:hypothetical protein